MIYEGVQYNSWKLYPTNVLLEQAAFYKGDNRKLLAEYLGLKLSTMNQYIGGRKKVLQKYILLLSTHELYKNKKFRKIYIGISSRELNTLCTKYETERYDTEMREYDYNCQMIKHRLEKEGIIQDYVESWSCYE